MSTTTKLDTTDDGNGGGDLEGGVTDIEQKKVVLLIRFDDHETFIKMKSNRVLLRLMTFYCELKNLNLDNVVFLFDGRHLPRNRTPDEFFLISMLLFLN
ncbi:unnamed protein product [Arabidopsis halleri]